MKIEDSKQRLAKFSSEIRKTTLKRLQEVPEGFMNWRLNNTAMSFAHIVQHLIDVDTLFFSLVNSTEKQFQWQMGSDEPNIVVDKPTYRAMIEKLKEFQLKRQTIISTLSDTKGNTEIMDNAKEKMTLWWFIMRKVLEHEIYHRGQIAAYLKILKGENFSIE